jgi:hypothetical protein
VTTPSTPTESVTETFSGSLTINGGVTFTFTTTGAGLVTLTLRSVGPDSTTQMGLGLGSWNGTSCNVQIPDDKATAGSSVVGQANAPGVLCARVYDVGQLKATATFEITVVHP